MLIFLMYSQKNSCIWIFKMVDFEIGKEIVIHHLVGDTH